MLQPTTRSALPEAGAGRTDDLRLVQQQVEELPRVAAGVDPDVGRVVAADARQAELRHRLADELRVAEVEIGERARLLLALRGEDGGGVSRMREMAASNSSAS